MRQPSSVIRKLAVVTIFGMLFCIIPSQALEQSSNPSPPPQPLFDPYFTWEDDFQTEEHIDPDLSSDYEVNAGKVGIKNTYPAWTDPAWTRLKPITLTSNASGSMTDYAVHLTIVYDSDMQADYGDLRFKHEDFVTSWLEYWVENSDEVSASIWVKIPVLPTGTSTLYLFYGNPLAESQSDFYSVFTTWQETWPNDEKITIHTNSEGAWDPEVDYGTNGFLVLWEEGQAYYPPYTWGFKQEIRGSLYGLDGSQIILDSQIYNDYTLYYHNEDPSAAFGSGLYFVAWEHYATTANPSASTMDIYARTVNVEDGWITLGDVQTVCDASNCQADPFVTNDFVNSRFCVVWEDGRNGVTNYNILGRLYDSSGEPIGTEKTITSAANNQCEPAIAFDPEHQLYLIAWEEGLTADVGPFSIKAQFFNKDLDPVGSVMAIATGTTDTDYNFPSVAYCELTRQFLIAWNDGDISDEDWYGNIWARIMDYSGNTSVPNFILKPGNFIRTDITPYLPSTFFVSFDSNGDVWGKMISSDGTVFPDDIQLSASGSAEADWAEMSVGDGRVFVSWEDTRVVYPSPWDSMPDVYGNIWQLNIPTSSEVSAEIGLEEEEILSAQVTSKVLSPENLVSWHEFLVDCEGSIAFNILDGEGAVLIAGVSDGGDLSGIDAVLHPGIRAQAILSRENPSYTPLLDGWSIVYVGTDDDPPETSVENITGMQGLNGWYVGNVKILLGATDGQYGSGVNHTYFRVDDGDTQEYDDASGIRLPQDATGDPNTLFGSWDIWYWSEDVAGNVESPQGPVKISIDRVQPYCSIWMPADGGSIPRHGGFWVQTTAKDNGSGIAYVLFDVGPPYENPVIVSVDDPVGSGNYKWYCDRDYTALQWKHIIARAYDAAGQQYEDNIYVKVSLGLSQQQDFGSLRLLVLQLVQWILEHLPWNHLLG